MRTQHAGKCVKKVYAVQVQLNCYSFFMELDILSRRRRRRRKNEEEQQHHSHAWGAQLYYGQESKSTQHTDRKT